MDVLGTNGGTQALECAHAFCRGCIATALRKQADDDEALSCPVCKCGVSEAVRAAVGPGRQLEESSDDESDSDEGSSGDDDGSSDGESDDDDDGDGGDDGATFAYGDGGDDIEDDDEDDASSEADDEDGPSEEQVSRLLAFAKTLLPEASDGEDADAQAAALEEGLVGLYLFEQWLRLDDVCRALAPEEYEMWQDEQDS